MKAYLITYNPDNWIGPNFKQVSDNTKKGIKQNKLGSCCTSLQVDLGDRIFLTKIGDNGSGIFAAGHCVGSSYQAPHFDSARAATGVTQPKIDVEFDWILDPDSDKYIDLAV